MKSLNLTFSLEKIPKNDMKNYGIFIILYEKSTDPSNNKSKEKIVQSATSTNKENLSKLKFDDDDKKYGKCEIDGQFTVKYQFHDTSKNLIDVY